MEGGEEGYDGEDDKEEMPCEIIGMVVYVPNTIPQNNRDGYFDYYLEWIAQLYF